MLKVMPILHPAHHFEHWQRFRPETETWIVSDLKSKFDLQKKILSSRPFVHGESVLRVSELWRLLLARLRPDMQLISREFALTLIEEYLSQKNLEWAHTPGAALLLYDYMTQLMPVLTHPEGDDILQEWFQENELSATRWQEWYKLAQTLWHDLLEQRLVTASWVSGVLVNELNFQGVWQRPLYFHLGADLSKVEADLIQTLSQTTDVTVFRPRPTWEHEFERTLRSYEILQSGPPAAPDKSSEPVGPAPVYRKFTTMLAEVKQATASVRRWLEEGIEAQQIAILAPDIELYWSVLSRYLQEEGIPVQKQSVISMHTLPNVTLWLSFLRSKAGTVSEADLETGVYSTQSAPLIPYARFQTLYTVIYDSSDLKRSTEIEHLFRADWPSDHKMERDGFLAWALSFLPSDLEPGHLDKILKNFFQECPATLVLSMSRWVRYFEFLVARTEHVVHVGDETGISILNLVSAESSEATHIIILGMTEKALRPSQKTALTAVDSDSLSAAFGVHLLTVDPMKIEFELRWLLSSSNRHFELYVAETDFAGDVQAPSWIWLQGVLAKGLPQVQIPDKTRWDQLQESELERVAQLRCWSEEHRQNLHQRLAQDRGQVPLPAISSAAIQKLSASGIEDYLSCPFVFAAKRVFSLSDDPYLDLDVDASVKGRFMHALLEELTTEPFQPARSEADLYEIVARVRTGLNEAFADERLWLGLQKYYVRMARRFLDFEKSWRQEFPNYKTIAREVALQGYIDFASGALCVQPPTQGVAVSGRIDRVDLDKNGFAAILDYKSSSYKLTNWKSWLPNNQIQLLFYAMSVENGLTSLPPHPVAVACYFVAKTMEREKGWSLKDVNHGLSPRDGSNKLTQEEKQKLFLDMQTLLFGVGQNIQAGAFAPMPAKPSECDECKWRDLCRAPHLN